MLAFVSVLIAASAAIVWLLAGPWWRRRRRRRWMQLEVPSTWHEWLEQHLYLYRSLPPELRTRLLQAMQIFVREKAFVGCNGLVVTEEMRVVIAAYACLLVINRPGVPDRQLYDELMSILVYPSQFIVHESDEEDGIVTEGHSVLAGQAWDAHRIILSWEDVQDSATALDNVVLHEFAHYLDMEDETMDGAPSLGDAAEYARWSKVFHEEYERLTKEVDAGLPTLLDPYAATEPAEFFAVATETFFHQPVELREQHPRLYRELAHYYRLDPASWTQQPRG